MKHVSELSKEEFQKTFPLILKEHQPCYKDWYDEEKRHILETVNPKDIIRINHIGSSAVEGLVAKPMIDILLEMDGSCNVTELIGSLKTIGFGEEIISRTEDPMRLLLGKGFSCNGYSEKVYLLHIRYYGDWDELYFRDYIREYPEVAKEYGELKLKIIDEIEQGIIERMPNGHPNGYSEAKLKFVQTISKKAKQQYQGRYTPK